MKNNKKMTEKEKIDSDNLNRLSDMMYRNYLLSNEIEKQMALERVNKYIKIDSEQFINTDFIVSIKLDMNGFEKKYVVDMADGYRYCIDKTEETERTINYLTSQKI